MKNFRKIVPEKPVTLELISFAIYEPILMIKDVTESWSKLYQRYMAEL